MVDLSSQDLASIRMAMAGFELSPKVVPNEHIEVSRAYFPLGHRGVLDIKRQLVVGNRGVGKSFWTHALVNSELRTKLASAYGLPLLTKSDVVIGFNGSEKLLPIAPTIDEIKSALLVYGNPDQIWRAVLIRAVHPIARTTSINFAQAMLLARGGASIYTELMSEADDKLASENRSLVIVFDALDRLASDWNSIRSLTQALLVRALGLQSFRSIRLKIFMRVDQFADAELFRFPDSSKIRNDYVSLTWKPHELFGLLFFELMRDDAARISLEKAAENLPVMLALQSVGRVGGLMGNDVYAPLVSAIAGEFMGGHKKRGKVFTWVPLHLSDAANDCSPRTFLTAWKSAAEHMPLPIDKVVDHLGLIDGVRTASSTRLTELREDYPWIDLALEPLRRRFVPMEKHELFSIWENSAVVSTILTTAGRERWLAPVGLQDDPSGSEALLQALSSIAVMEERSNHKINVPDIFRVEAGILRKGGVAVPKRA